MTEHITAQQQFADRLQSGARQAGPLPARLAAPPLEH